MASRILIIEDEQPLRMAMADALGAEQYEILEAADGKSGLRLALAEAPDLILLDLMLPELDGFSLLRALREDRLTSPVIILSARGEEFNLIQGFEFGADDYLVKPVSTRLLVLRIRSLLRRAQGETPGIAGTGGRARFGAVEIDFPAYSLTRGGERFGLSRRELELLRFFLGHPRETLSRRQILDHVWGEDAYPTTRTIDAHILKLRKKIEPVPDAPRHLVTVHGVGYRFEP